MNERLQELVNFLKKLPIHRFRYDTWFSSNVLNPIELLQPCGTTGCALGWAAALWPEYWTFKGGIYMLVPCTANELDPYKSAAKFFDVTEQDAIYLFRPSLGEIGLTGPEVADKIQRFINGDVR